MQLSAALSDAVHAFVTPLVCGAASHPVPFVLRTPLAVPSPSSPTPRANMLRECIHEAYGGISHVLLLTDAPPYPRRLVALAQRAELPLSKRDLLHVLNIPTCLEREETNQNNRAEWDGRLFLEGSAYSKRVRVSSRKIHLRLDPDHHDAFKRAVGDRWRPAWGVDGGHILHVIVLADTTASTEMAEKILEDVEMRLDRSAEALDVIVGIERPLELVDIFPQTGQRINNTCIEPGRGVTAVLFFERDRLMGTPAAFRRDSLIGISRVFGGNSRRVGSCEISVNGNSLLVCRERRVFVWFDGVEVESAVKSVEMCVIPFLRRHSHALVPLRDRVNVFRTLLGDLLAPFDR